MTVLVGIDSGAITQGGGFAWYDLTPAAATSPPQRKWSYAHDPNRLVARVVKVLTDNEPLVIAIEAPIWVPARPYTLAVAPSGGRSWAMGYRFPAESGYAWYLGGAPGVTVNALTILAYLFGQLTARKLSGAVTDDPTLWNSRCAQILLCESFLPPKRKPLVTSMVSCPGVCFRAWRQDTFDALVSAVLAGILFAGIAKPCWLPGTVQVLAPNPPLSIKRPRGVTVIGSSVTARPLWPWALTGTNFTSMPATGGTAPFTLGLR